MGVILFSLGFYIWKNSNTPGKNIGRVEVYKGQVLLKSHGSTESKTIEQDSGFNSGSLIISALASDAVLEFGDTRIKLRPDTQVFVESVPPHILVYLQKGNLEAELAIPETSPVMIESGLQRVPAKKFFAESKTSSTKTESSPTQSGLTQDSIQNALKKEQPLFFRCYTQLLQRSPKAKGSVELVFTILSSGKVTQSQVAGGQLKDENFRKCLIDVVSRVEFPRFDGSSVSAVFPLNFE